MKHLLPIALFGLFLQPVCAQNMKTTTQDPETLKINTTTTVDKADRNNNFYDNEPTYLLPTVPLEIAGEIENPGKVDFSKLPKRSVIVKETLLKEDGSNAFVGAYRYDGYSLFDILTDRILKKNNREVFPPIIDTYVEVENAQGEKVVLSWGELFYPNNLHNILISPEILIRDKSRVMEKMITIPESIQSETLHTVFYGKGRGIHSTQPFTGVFLKDLLNGKFNFDREILRTGLITIVGLDGYRVVYSFSEVMNRNDQAEVLVVPLDAGVDGGKYRIFPSCDFFSDRAVKAISEIYVEK